MVGYVSAELSAGRTARNADSCCGIKKDANSGGRVAAIELALDLTELPRYTSAF